MFREKPLAMSGEGRNDLEIPTVEEVFACFIGGVGENESEVEVYEIEDCVYCFGMLVAVT